MATIAEQRAAVNAKFDDQASIYGEHNPLTPAQETENTDLVAEVLEDVNPNHKYPPVNK